MFGEDYKLWSSSSCNFVYSSATASFLGSNSRRSLGTYLHSRSDARGNTTQNNQEEKCRHCDGLNYWHISASRLVMFVSSHQGWIECVMQETWCYQIQSHMYNSVTLRIFGSSNKPIGTRWLSWLRHCATSRKVAGSIPDGVIRIFHWHNPSGRTMVLGSTQPLTEMSTRNISWRVKAAGA